MFSVRDIGFNARYSRYFDHIVYHLFDLIERCTIIMIALVSSSVQMNIVNLKNQVKASGFLRVTEGELRRLFTPQYSRLGCKVRKELESQLSQYGIIYSPQGIFDTGGNCKDRELLICLRNCATGKLMEAFTVPRAETDNVIRETQGIMERSNRPQRPALRQVNPAQLTVEE